MSIYKDFVEDYNNMNITAHDVRRMNNLNSREYSNLRARAINNGDIPPVRHMNNTTAKFYYQKPNGNWSVQKQFSDIHIHVGDFPNEETAKMIRDKCIEVNWELNKIQSLIDENKIQKVKNYTLTNGYWVVSKSINGELVNFVTVRADKVSEEIIRAVVDCFRAVGWDKKYKDMICKEFNIS